MVISVIDSKHSQSMNSIYNNILESHFVLQSYKSFMVAEKKLLSAGWFENFQIFHFASLNMQDKY